MPYNARKQGNARKVSRQRQPARYGANRGIVGHLLKQGTKHPRKLIKVTAFPGAFPLPGTKREHFSLLPEDLTVNIYCEICEALCTGENVDKC